MCPPPSDKTLKHGTARVSSNPQTKTQPSLEEERKKLKPFSLLSLNGHLFDQKMYIRPYLAILSDWQQWRPSFRKLYSIF